MSHSVLHAILLCKLEVAHLLYQLSQYGVPSAKAELLEAQLSCHDVIQQTANIDICCIKAMIFIIKRNWTSFV